MATRSTAHHGNMKAANAISVGNFFNSAVKAFSHQDNIRSIPTITDGLKPSQRKAIFGTMKGRGERPPLLSVERLAAGVAERTDYHHGVGSMVSTIAGMGAVAMPGMNNMNLFVPGGQFGSRLTKDAGAGRYIESTISAYFRQIFKKEDDIILKHHIVDGHEIEPITYIPLLPFVLVNGGSGTGTGHACEIKPYHPNDLRDVILKILDGKFPQPGKLVPWFRGYHGTVERNPENGQVITKGKLEVVNSTVIQITELPVGVYLDQYKEHLNNLIEKEFIKDFDDGSSEDSFDFRIIAPRSTTSLPLDELYQKFKLIGRDTENFTVWNADGYIQKFATAEDLIEAFVPWRLERYEERRQVTIADINENVRLLSETIRFIKFYLGNVKLFSGTGKKQLIEVLLENKFADYEKLLSMAIWNLTKDKIEELENKLTDLKKTLSALENDTAEEMYKRELKTFTYKEDL